MQQRFDMPYVKERAPFDVMCDGIIKRSRGFNRSDMRTLVTNITVLSLTRYPHQIPIDPITDGIVNDISKRVTCRGDVNYILCRVTLESMKPKTGWSYHSLSDVLLVLETAAELFPDEFEPGVEEEALYDCVSVVYDAADEIRRRLLAPYEDTATRKNGDMACFQEPFAYMPPLDAEFDKPRGPDCECKRDTRHRPVEKDKIPLITEALSQEQVDAVDRERMTAEQHRDMSQEPPSATPRNLGP
jgi:hypothetical protein